MITRKQQLQNLINDQIQRLEDIETTLWNVHQELQQIEDKISPLEPSLIKLQKALVSFRELS